MLPAAAFVIANLIGNAGIRFDSSWMNAQAIVLIAAGIGYTYISFAAPEPRPQQPMTLETYLPRKWVCPVDGFLRAGF